MCRAEGSHIREQGARGMASKMGNGNTQKGIPGGTEIVWDTKAQRLRTGPQVLGRGLLCLAGSGGLEDHGMKSHTKSLLGRDSRLVRSMALEHEVYTALIASRDCHPLHVVHRFPDPWPTLM